MSDAFYSMVDLVDDLTGGGSVRQATVAALVGIAEILDGIHDTLKDRDPGRGGGNEQEQGTRPSSGASFGDSDPADQVPPVRVHERGRGLLNYGDPVDTDYGSVVSVYDSSAAETRCCWLLVNGPGTGVTVHLTEEQAAAIRDRLTAFLDHAQPEAEA